MNGSGSGSSKNILEAEAEAEAASFKKLEAEAEALHAEPEAEAKMVKNSPLPHHWFRRPDIWAFRQKFSRVLKDIVSFGSAAEKKKYKSIGIRNITSCKQRMFQWRSKGYPISTVDARGSVS